MPNKARCSQCKANFAFGIFACTKRFFDSEIVEQRFLCATCGFTEGYAKRAYFSKQLDTWLMADKYIKVELIYQLAGRDNEAET